ncbi:type IV toxin-antitoxin system AbiEi family antitoxin [Pseudomonas sp. dw_358]|uniref:type IV toxin-antitoxin system AbiEi family antitoxin n=1 Tax=Pseudomonas sp. dw_358 TaxID=2720083 RepID=UPI001BD5F44A|nr:type IV toxin-antitoxin system AbiEi family antitoxin [Pseudomonas sp. dw_358]
MDHYHQQAGGAEFENLVLEELTRILGEAFGHDATVRRVAGMPFASAADSEPDGLIEIRTPYKTLVVYVEVKRHVYPRDIREGVWALNKYMRYQDHSHDAIGMIAAGSLSPGARDELKAENIAFFDLGGSLHLKHETWLISINKPSRRLKNYSHSVDLFTDARGSVVHALLMHANAWLTGAELAEQAQTSPYTCSVVLQELTLREWVESSGGGPSKRRMLIRPEKLLDAWAEQWQERKEKRTRWYTFVENPKHMLAHLADRIDRARADFPWAFTGASAANVIAPLLTSTDGVELIVPKGYAEKMADMVGLKPVTKGANVTLIEREPASLLYRNRHAGHPAFLASAYILYLDLLDGRGRNKELAEHIREHLESLWQRD